MSVFPVPEWIFLGAFSSAAAFVAAFAEKGFRRNAAFAACVGALFFAARSFLGEGVLYGVAQGYVYRPVFFGVCFVGGLVVAGVSYGFALAIATTPAPWRTENWRRKIAAAVLTGALGMLPVVYGALSVRAPHTAYENLPIAERFIVTRAETFRRIHGGPVRKDLPENIRASLFSDEDLLRESATLRGLLDEGGLNIDLLDVSYSLKKREEERRRTE